MGLNDGLWGIGEGGREAAALVKNPYTCILYMDVHLCACVSIQIFSYL